MSDNNLTCDTNVEGDTNLTCDTNGICTQNIGNCIINNPVDTTSLNTKELMIDLDKTLDFLDCVNSSYMFKNNNISTNVSTKINSIISATDNLKLYDFYKRKLNLTASFNNAKNKLVLLKELQREIKIIESDTDNQRKKLLISINKLDAQKQIYGLLKKQIIEYQNILNDLHNIHIGEVNVEILSIN